MSTGHTYFRSVLLIIISVVGLVIAPGASWAQWVDGGQLVNGGWLGGNNNFPNVVSVGNGSTIVTWVDADTGPYQVHAQKYDADGVPQWGPLGYTLNGGVDHIQNCQAVSDGQGGLVAVWGEHLDEVSEYRVTGQRIDADGNLLWGPNGIRIGGGLFDDGRKTRVCINSTNSSFFILFKYLNQLRMQNVGIGGALFAGTEGVLVADTNASDYEITSQGDGGALVAWMQPSNWDYFAKCQRYDANLNTLWGENGVVVGGPLSGIEDICLSARTTEGCFVAFTGDYSLNLVRVNGSGMIEGSPFVDSEMSQSASHLQLVEGPDEGIFLSWLSGGVVQSRRFDEWVNPQWDTVSVSSSSTGLVFYDLLAESDGAGGEVLAWITAGTLFSQRIDAGGDMMWQPESRMIGPAVVNAGFSLASSSEGVFHYAWCDTRPTEARNIFTQKIGSDGFWCETDPAIQTISDIENDNGGWVGIQISASGLDQAGVFTYPIYAYNLWRRVDARAGAVVESGFLDKDSLLRDLTSTGLQVGEVIPEEIASSMGFPEGNWQSLGLHVATQQPEFEILAPTVADSCATGLKPSTYLITAHTTTPALYFVSEAASGYSVDNLPPGVPGSMSAAYQASGVDLDWNDATETDFQCFRIYRGEEPGFIPSEETLIIQTIDSSYHDPLEDPWGYYYLITVLDHVGNESEPGAPQFVTGVPDQIIAAKTSLLGASPNPFNPSTAISYRLQRDEVVFLEIYDVAGRLVRTLVSGRAETAGEKTQAWDGRDNGGRVVPAGIYFVRLEAGDFSGVSRMTMIK
jgi:hypothetical protein